MIAFNFLGAILCLSSIAIIAGVIVFRIAISRHQNQTKSMWLAIITSIFVFFGIPSLIQGVSYLNRGSWHTFTKEDIPGVWSASYVDYGCWWFTGTEFLTFNDDFTYEQLFIDVEGNRQYVAQGNWQLIEQVVLLTDAKRPPDHFSGDECSQVVTTPLNSLASLEDREVQLNVWSNLFANDRIMLETNPVGDPDAPDYTKYFKSK